MKAGLEPMCRVFLWQAVLVSVSSMLVSCGAATAAVSERPEITSQAAMPQNGSALTGAVNSGDTAKAVNLTLDATSAWTVTADSYLTYLDDKGGISGSSITNIVGNGHTVYYDQAACLAQGGQTYALSGGGTAAGKLANPNCYLRTSQAWHTCEVLLFFREPAGPAPPLPLPPGQ